MTPSTSSAAAAPIPLKREDTAGLEVPDDEIWVASGFRPERYEAGLEVPWRVGVYFLDTASGVVRGWTCPELRVCHPYHLSPSNRFVLSGLYLHDRETGRTRTLVDVIEIAAGHHLIGWGEGHDERLLVRPLTRSPGTQYVVVNTTFEPVARVGHIGRGFFGLHVGPHVTATPDGHLWILDLESGLDPAGVPIIERPLPGDLRWPDEGVAVMSVGEAGVALLARGDGESVRVVRYGWDGALLSDASIANLPITDGLSVSPDRRRIAALTFPAPSSSDWLRSRGMAVSIFDATSGEEMLRITGASTSPTALWGEVPVSAPRTSYSMWWNQAGWLADSSGLLVGTVHGERLVTLDGGWEQVVGRPAPDDTDLFAHVGRTKRGSPIAPGDHWLPSGSLIPSRSMAGSRTSRLPGAITAASCEWCSPASRSSTATVLRPLHRSRP